MAEPFDDDDLKDVDFKEVKDDDVKDDDVVVTKSEHNTWSVRNITSEVPIELDSSSSEEECRIPGNQKQFLRENPRQESPEGMAPDHEVASGVAGTTETNSVRLAMPHQSNTFDIPRKS